MTQSKKIISDKINTLISILEGVPNEEIEEVIRFILNNRNLKHVLIFPNTETTEMQVQISGVSVATVEAMFIALLCDLRKITFEGGCVSV